MAKRRNRGSMLVAGEASRSELCHFSTCAGGFRKRGARKTRPQAFNYNRMLEGHLAGVDGDDHGQQTFKGYIRRLPSTRGLIVFAAFVPPSAVAREMEHLESI